MTSNSEIRFYIDTMIVEAILSDEGFYKKAEEGAVSKLTESVKGYVSNHIDPNDKTGSLLNMLAPGAISVMFSAMGLGKIGLLFSLAASVFHIDVKGILQSIYDGVKSLISGGGKVSSSQIDGLVNSAVQSHAGSNEDPSLLQTASINQELKDAKMLKLSLISYDKEIRGFDKQADLSSLFSSRKRKTAGILGRVISWIFKIALASAGFMVAGDAVNKLLDRPNAFDGSIKDGKPVETTNAPIMPISKQTKFPIKAGFVDTRYNFTGNNWIEKINNSKSSIDNMLVSFAKEIYEGLDGQDGVIRNSPIFQDIAEEIAWYNHSAVGDPIVFIPKKYTSKKQLVDFFIDQVASAGGNLPPNNVKPVLPPGSYLV